MANTSWPSDNVPNNIYPNAFSGGNGGGPLLNHQHLTFEVSPSDVDGSGNVQAGAALQIGGIDSTLPVGAVLVYEFDPDQNKGVWYRPNPPVVVAISSYPGPPGAPIAVTTIQAAPRARLHAVAIESTQAWTDWVTAWAVVPEGGGGTGNQGDGNGKK
jgi:hypothetical protein